MKPIRNGVMALLLLLGSQALAGQEAEDLKRQIESQRAAVSDLERLDDRHMVTDEITLLKSWLDEAWQQYSKEEGKRVGEGGDRCVRPAGVVPRKSHAGQ